MDPLFDEFTAFDSQYNRKFENLFDQDFSLSSPFSENSDSTGIFPAQFPKTIKNLLDVDDSATNRLLRANNNQHANKAKPFQIIKQKKDFSPEHSEFTEPAESIASFNMRDESDVKIHTKSKRIAKPEKPKEKIKFKQDPESIMKRVDARYIPEGFDNPDLDDQTKKKMVQMIRNRVSAQSSRDKKKMYLQQLEDARDELIEENTILIKDKEILQNRIRSLEHDRAILIEENESLKKGANFLCSKCGCTLECDVNPENQNMESTDSSASSPVGLHRAHRRSKNFFGFTLGFAALMCVLFVMNGGLPSYGGNNVSIKTGTGKYTGRYIATHIMPKEQDVCENQGITQNPMPTSASLEGMTITEEEEVFEPIVEGETSGVLDVINSLMDQFSKLHETYFQSYETNNKDIISLPEVQSFENRAIATASDCNSAASEDFEKHFTNKSPFIGAQNKSSTLFCPNGFEFFKTNLNIEIDNEKEINFFNSAEKLAGLSKSKALDLEKAEYIQLILPKQSISRLSLSEYYNDLTNIPVSKELEKQEEENTLIEVWCKIFAIRDVVTTF